MRPIFKQMAELIGKAIAELRKSIEPRVKTLEDQGEKLTVQFAELKQHLGKDSEATQLKVNEVLQIKVDTQGLLETFARAGEELTQKIEELRARTLADIAAAITAHGQAVQDQLSLQNQLTGELRAMLDAKAGEPALEEIVSKCLTVLRGSDPKIHIPDVSGFLVESQVLALIENATRGLQPIMDLAVVAREVAGRLPSIDEVALQAATLIDVPKVPDFPDTSKFLTQEQVEAIVTGAVETKQSETEKLLRVGFAAMPSIDDIAQKAASLVEFPAAPDLTGFVNEGQVQAIIKVHVDGKVDMAAVSAAIVEHLPSLDDLASKAARLIEVPVPNLSGYALVSETQASVDAAVKEVLAEVKTLRDVFDEMPTAESVIEKAISKIQIPDTSTFLNADQVQEMIAEDRMKFAVPPVTSDQVVKLVLAQLPAPVSVEDAAKIAASLIPAPKDGKSVELDQVLELVQKAVAATKMPTAEEVASSLGSTHIANWALDFERRAQDLLQRSVSQFPKPKDGMDGLGFDDMTVEFDGQRTFKFVFARGERRKEYSFKAQFMIHRGIYEERTKYESGDVITFGGSSWISLKDFPQGKPGQSHDWQLIVKKGRDGSPK
jgi:hypothetical protein